MSRQTLLIIVRQAGSAAGILPAAERLITKASDWSLLTIAFPQAVATCREVVEQTEMLKMHEVHSEDEARYIFESYIKSSQVLLTGTSAEADADAHYWRQARAHGVQSVAFLDQGSNIQRRFPGPTLNDWPDYVAVIDEFDKDLARQIAPKEVEIHVTGSPALERIKREVHRLREMGVEADSSRLVFATEPVLDLRAYRLENGFCDEDSFDLALQIIRIHHRGATLVLRLHPRDSRERWLQKLPSDLRIEWDNDTRAVCLARAAKIFGMRSFFLLEAYVAGISVVSLQPNKKTTSPLTDGRMPVLTNAAEYKP